MKRALALAVAACVAACATTQPATSPEPVAPAQPEAKALPAISYPAAWAPVVAAKQACPDLSGQYSYFGDTVSARGPGRAALGFLFSHEWSPNTPANRRATHVTVEGPKDGRLYVSAWEGPVRLFGGNIYSPSEFDCVNNSLVRRWDSARDSTYAFGLAEDGALVARQLRADYALLVAGKDSGPTAAWLRWRPVDEKTRPEGRKR